MDRQGDNIGHAAPSKPPAPLSVPIFRYFWFASILSNFGVLIQSVGAAWLMTSLSSAPLMIALVQSSNTLPIMLFSLLSGAIADNLDRRKVMIAAQAFMGLTSVCLVLLAWADLLNPWLLLCFTFLLGCGLAINSPSLAASVGDMVPRETVPAAVALNSMGFNIARSIGPAIGGILVASAGVAAAFVVNAVSYIGVIGVLIRWRPGFPKNPLPRESLVAAMMGGPRYVLMSPHLRVVMLRSALFGIFASAAPALMPLIARDVIGGDAGTYGLLSAGFGIGAVFGALVTARLRSHLSTENLLRLAAFLLAGGTAVAGASTVVIMTLIAMVLAGSGWVLGLSTFNILVQMASPRWVVGRALACYQMCAFGAMAIGATIIGVMAGHLGVMATLLILAMAQAGNILIGFLMPVDDVDALNLDPLLHSYEPETEVPVSPRSGPVIITMDYNIAAEDVPAFLSAMMERRRILRRDGASGWTLMRDLGDRERWIERYHVSTWVDYLRHIRRRTHEDAGAWQSLVALHRGSSLPTVTRMLERIPRRTTIDPVSDSLTDPARLV